MLITERPALIAIQNVLFATDFSSTSERALPFALEFATRYNATLFVAHAVPPMPAVVPIEPVPDQTDVLRKGAGQEMQRFVAKQSLKEIPHQAIVMDGEVWDVIRQVVADKRIDLVVLGTRGRGVLHKLLVGSIAEEIYRTVKCPVLTIGPEVIPPSLPRQKMWRIVFATDFSTGSLHALPYALMFTQEHHSQTTFLHVIAHSASLPADSADQLVHESVARMKELIPEGMEGSHPDFKVEFGSPGPDIVRIATDLEADLLVMGVHAGHHATSHLPWSVASYVLSHARCPVLTVRGGA
ncbi:UspA [Candidatus Koribacter versatilis Ellin345]|uniref:UspA n=1 Tax=Koribacter versatilis (strain Ellin345) TaxID=204669 RepID=Q1IMF8_KORVE|nr:universal stress protein [Candidatus Koribacter versatilis]ABF41942.1 UspA [Candidatus Koribacter versatilis Ellin345]